MKSRSTRANIFHFKKFSIDDSRCAMKVGTDAVLLGAWVNIHNAKRILDIGTGSGVIALMLAQRIDENAKIDAVEIAKDDAQQATENIKASPWEGKVIIHESAIQDYDAEYRYDLIVSNPPYFINSLTPPTQSRTQARHAQSLSFEELINHSVPLLNPNGRLAVILPVAESNTFKLIANSKQLSLIRETAFYSRENKPQERWLLEFSLTHQSLASDKLILYDTGGNKSSRYLELTGDFYL